MSKLFQPHTHTIGPGDGEELITVHDMGGLTEPEIRQLVASEPGRMGQDGMIGPKGDQGIQGVPGSSGSLGAPGLTGPTGITGGIGATGAPGAPSTVPGPAGPSGSVSPTVATKLDLQKGGHVSGFAETDGWAISGLKNIMITDTVANAQGTAGDVGDIVFVYRAPTDADNGVYVKSILGTKAATWHKVA